jgi:AcrR family transcriptional regulator
MEDGRNDEIMEATYRALCENGYAGLTMQDIADESEKSKATLHYHYDTKQELLLAFLDYMLDEFHDRLEREGNEDPTEELVGLLTPREDEVGDGFRTAMLEMKAQSPYNEGIRRKLIEYETELKGYLSDVIRSGVDDGVFRDDLDAEETAETLVALGNGLRTRSVTVGKSDDELRATVETYVETCLVEEGDG